MSQRSAQARIAFWHARSAYIGPALEVQPHSAGAAVLCVAVDGEVHSVLGRAQPSASWTTSRSVLVPAGAMHSMRFSASQIACIYMDPLDDDLSDVLSLMAAHGPLPTGHVRDAQLASLLREVAEKPAEWRGRRREIEVLAGLKPRSGRDPAVARLLELLRREPGAPHRLRSLAIGSGLSETRLRHRFRAEIGVPFSSYRRWFRIGAAMRLAGSGATLTQAAHEAGFASSAHFSSAFRAMFGLAPSTLVRAGLSL